MLNLSKVVRSKFCFNTPTLSYNVYSMRFAGLGLFMPCVFSLLNLSMMKWCHMLTPLINMGSLHAPLRFYHIHRMEHLPVVYEQLACILCLVCAWLENAIASNCLLRMTWLMTSQDDEKLSVISLWNVNAQRCYTQAISWLHLRHAHRCHHHLTDGSAWDAHLFSGAGFPEDFFFLLQAFPILHGGVWWWNKKHQKAHVTYFWGWLFTLICLSSFRVCDWFKFQ